MRLRQLALAVLAALVAAGCSWVPRSVEILDVFVLPDDRTLEILVASCNADHNVEVQEDGESVAVWVTAANGSDGDCSDAITIELRAQLGDRVFVDGHDLEVLEVEVEAG